MFSGSFLPMGKSSSPSQPGDSGMVFSGSRRTQALLWLLLPACVESVNSRLQGHWDQPVTQNTTYLLATGTMSPLPTLFASIQPGTKGDVIVQEGL